MASKIFKRHRDYGFFDQDIRLSKLSKLGDPLEKLSKSIDFEMFRSIIESKIIKPSKGAGGRRPYDYILMFKILILQRYFSLSDDQVEFQVNDRMSFMRFLNLTIADDIPDSKTVWNFREQLINNELIESLFDIFLRELDSLGMILKEGSIIDASFVETPCQRNNREENKKIKSEGQAPEEWTETPHKLAQKDVDARWTKKGNQVFFGYKNHIKTDSKSKIVTKYKVTDASVHDSQALADLVTEDDKDKVLYADSAYKGQKQDSLLNEKQIMNEVHERAYKDKPLTEKQIASNKIKSKTRVRVEHIFGFMENTMDAMYIYNIGIKRATAIIGLINLTYNMFRKIQIEAR